MLTARAWCQTVRLVLLMLVLGSCTPTPSGPVCGQERWPVKTMADRDVARVDLRPQTSSVSSLRELKAPATLPKDRRVGPAEIETYVIRAQVRETKLEDDGDIHVVLATPGRPQKTIIVELPNVECSKATQSWQDAMVSARQAFIGICGLPELRLKPCSAQVEVTGVGFFDFIHGQTGVAPNGIELHPVLAVRRLDSPAEGPSR